MVSENPDNFTRNSENNSLIRKCFVGGNWVKSNISINNYLISRQQKVTKNWTRQSLICDTFDWKRVGNSWETGNMRRRTVSSLVSQNLIKFWLFVEILFSKFDDLITFSCSKLKRYFFIMDYQVENSKLDCENLTIVE